MKCPNCGDSNLKQITLGVYKCSSCGKEVSEMLLGDYNSNSWD